MRKCKKKTSLFWNVVTYFSKYSKYTDKYERVGSQEIESIGNHYCLEP